MRSTLTLLLTLILGSSLAAGCTTQTPAPSETPLPRGGDEPVQVEADTAQPEALKVLFAGSLIIPFHELEEAYEAEHPEIDVQMEGHGSIQAIRHVTEIHDEVDVVVPADHNLIPMLMYESSVPETGEPYADWYVKFASNEVALAYTDDSQFADEIDADNWHEILRRPGVTLGISDPRMDACGYRALMVMQMAEELYEDPLLFEELVTSRFTTPIRWHEEDGKAVIRVPEIVEPKKGSGMVMRGYSVALIGLLESGNLDYAFQYESVIEQHGFRQVDLPQEIDLGSEEMEEHYEATLVRGDFRRFATVEPVFSGEVIGYGVTIPANAPHPNEAIDFVAFLLGPEGRAVMEANSHPPLERVEAHNYEAVPDDLKDLCVPME